MSLILKLISACLILTNWTNSVSFHNLSITHCKVGNRSGFRCEEETSRIGTKILKINSNSLLSIMLKILLLLVMDNALVITQNKAREYSYSNSEDHWIIIEKSVNRNEEMGRYTCLRNEIRHSELKKTGVSKVKVGSVGWDSTGGWNKQL